MHNFLVVHCWSTASNSKGEKQINLEISDGKRLFEDKVVSKQFHSFI